jgi:hypothetical protein
MAFTHLIKKHVRLKEILPAAILLIQAHQTWIFFEMDVKNENEIWFTASGTGVGYYNIKTGRYTFFPLKKQASAIGFRKRYTHFFQTKK